MSGESKNSMIVYLNQEGLNTLFPEGTQARIQLGEAVLAKAIGTHVKGLLVPQIADEIGRQVKEAVKLVKVEDMIRENFTKSSWYDPHKLLRDSKLDVAIKEAVSNAFSEATLELVTKAVDAKLEAVTTDIERRVNYEVDRRLAGITNEMVKARVNEALAKIQLV